MLLFLSEVARKTPDKVVILQIIQFATVLVHNLMDNDSRSTE